MHVPPGCPLSPREFQTLALRAAGLNDQQIATKLNIARSTVRTHLAKVRQVLNVSTCEQAIVLAFRSGWLNRQPDALPHLALERPFLHAYLASFDRWQASKQDDVDHCRAMDLALSGAALEPKNTAWLDGRRRRHPSQP